MATLPTIPPGVTTQNLLYPSGTTKYYTNCRGTNYLPLMTEEWRKSGWLPRLPETVAGSFFGYPTSTSFQGHNKTAQWWYYNSADNKRSVELLRGLGINALRVFTNIYVWARKRQQHLQDLQDFMKICDRNKMRVQLVLWDGVYIPEGSNLLEPQNRASTVSSLEFGLTYSWMAVPHAFELSSAAQTSDFFTTCATPFINDICSSVSSFQSLWSIDIANEEPRQTYGSSLIVSSSNLLNRNLSSIGVGLTFGHGNDYSPYSATLTNGNGIWDGYPNEIYRLAPYIHFASIHPYVTNNKMMTSQYVRDAVSGATALGIPGMYNEGANPDLGNYTFVCIKHFNIDNNFGGLLFDGLIDYAASYEPFLSTQGLLYADGQCRSILDSSSYIDLAKRHNWLRPSQLNRELVEKSESTNNGVDGGYYSGVIPEHAEFDPDEAVSATQIRWQFAKDLLYGAYPGISKNYLPYPGHPLNSTNYSFTASAYTIENYVSAARAYQTIFTPLSSINPVTNFIELNRQLVIRDQILQGASFNTVNMDNRMVWPELRGSQYDFLPASALRLTLSAQIFSSTRTDGSSIKAFQLSAGPVVSGNIPCLATSSCIYTSDGHPNIDWNAYNTYYNQCFANLNTYLDELETLAETDSRYVLY